MPIIVVFKGVKIYVYNGAHRPPHIHAIYNEFEVLLKIEDGMIYAGYLPRKQLKWVNDWLTQNAEWVLNIFYELNPHLL